MLLFMDLPHCIHFSIANRLITYFRLAKKMRSTLGLTMAELLKYYR